MTGVKKRSIWIKKGITYRKSLYLTFKAANRQPGPKVANTVITRLTGTYIISLRKEISIF